MPAPNVIIIMSDQMKATASHLYGSTFCQTPSLERMANEGILYKHAVTPHPLCVPCRISFWTSQFPHSHGGRRNQTLMPGDATHAFKLWKEAGYKCGLIRMKINFGLSVNHSSYTADHDPMFTSVMVHLQTKRGSCFNLDTFYL